jgi:hypothetical protein
MLKIASGLASSIACTTAPRSRLLGHELDVGLRLLDHGLERFDPGLAVFEVRIDQRPALLLGGDCIRHQHRHLHVGRGPQAEGVAVAVLPGDLVGQRLGGEEEHLLLAGELGDGEPDVGEERAGDDVDALARDQLVGDAHRVAGIGAVVARHHLELLAKHAALGVDLLDRELPPFLVGVEERRLGLVAVELADLDRALREGGHADRRERGGRRGELNTTKSGGHADAPFHFGGQ